MIADAALTSEDSKVRLITTSVPRQPSRCARAAGRAPARGSGGIPAARLRPRKWCHDVQARLV